MQLPCIIFEKQNSFITFEKYKNFITNGNLNFF